MFMPSKKKEKKYTLKNDISCLRKRKNAERKSWCKFIFCDRRERRYVP